ncbi:MAG: Asp23/Gls24 family envelope stress response protein [Clostridia bacterium]|nr:Asp23/Gls24 family envelope stress response protein [Clostridia bacterium]
MKVYSLVGKSGTGKSHHSMDLCIEKGIGTIVDDGLLIHKNHAVAGKSAKRAETKIGAVKTALFTEDEHANLVRDKIKELGDEIDQVLVIGTSDKMVDKIVDRLGLPQVEERIYIEDITTEEERKTASKQREVMGKHVIPASTFEIKRNFAGYFVDPLQIFRDVADRALDLAPSDERTVVRPTFSYLGKYYISDKVIEDIIQCVADFNKKDVTVLKVTENSKPDDMIINLTISCAANGDVMGTALKLQEDVKKNVEMMTAFNLSEVNVEVKEVVFR